MDYSIPSSTNHNSMTAKKWLVLLLIPILNWGLFWFVGFPHNFEKALALASSVILLFVFFIGAFKKNLPHNSYGSYIRSFIILSFISIINAWIYWGQAPWLTFSAGYGIFIYAYYYVLKELKVTQSQLIKIQVSLAIIYSILWLIALTKAPDVVFGTQSEIGDDRGAFRIVFCGFDFVCLLYYYSLIKYLDDIKNLKNLIIVVVLFLMMFATLSRMIIATTIICSCLYVIRKKSFKVKLMVILVFALSYGAISQNQIVQNLFELNERLNDSGEDGIVRSEWSDSFELFPFHIGTMLFGNGQDHVYSDYGKMCESLKDEYSFHREDVGYVGLYVTYGILAVFVFTLIFFKVLRQKVPEEFYYYKLFILHFIIASITTYYFVDWGTSLTMALFSLDQIRRKMDNSIIRSNDSGNVYLKEADNYA